MGCTDSKPTPTTRKNTRGSPAGSPKKKPHTPSRKKSHEREDVGVIGGVTLAERRRLATETHFSLREVHELCRQYEQLSSSRDDDGVIDATEWGDAFKKKVGETYLDSLPHMFVDRMFQLFDGDGNGEIDLVEFIKGLSVFSKKGTQQEKVKFAFRLYDIDRDGKISRDELKAILRGCIREADQRTNSSSVSMSEERLDDMVGQTFEEADTDCNGYIDFEEFERMVELHPDIISNITFRSSILEKSF